MGVLFLRNDDHLKIIQNSTALSCILNHVSLTGSTRDISIEVLGHADAGSLDGAMSSQSDDSLAIDGVEGESCEWSVLVSMLVLFWGAILFSFLLLFATLEGQDHVDGGKVSEIGRVNCIFIFKIFSFVDKANQLGCNSLLLLNLLFKRADALLWSHVEGQRFRRKVFNKDLHLIINNYYIKLA